MGFDVAQEKVEGIPPIAMGSIASTLLAREQFALDGYRPSYVARRIAARLAATGHSIDTYARTLSEDDVERRLLIGSLGINVTAFFHDEAVWQFLEEVALPPLLDERAQGEPFHVLSLGCAGGHEPYSMAMLLAELTQGQLRRFEVEAVDMDHDALDVAREAQYPSEAMTRISAAALARYFDKEKDGFRVKQALRERVSVHRRDILTAGVEGRFDLVLMRNVLIYFSAAAKERIFQDLHRSLTGRGLVVLGQAETITASAADLFRPLSLRNRVYARVER